VIGAILGIPEADAESVRAWSDESLHRDPDEEGMGRNHESGGLPIRARRA